MSEETSSEVIEETAVVEEAAAALGDTELSEEEAALAEYKTRLRTYIRELKKLPGDWYIIQCYSGYENKVKTNLDMRAQTLEVEDSIYDVVVPIEEVVEIREGKRKLVKRKLLPGYVLVRMDINDRSWSVVRDTPGVTSFVGNEGHPETSEAEKAVVADGEKVVASPTPSTANTIEVDYQVDEVVTILTGPFASISATISEIDAQGGKLTGMISFMGREMPVELTFDQVEKIN